MRVVAAVEQLVPAAGGAERFLLDALGALAARGHRVRALWSQTGPGADWHRRDLPPGVEGRAVPAELPPGAGYWAERRARAAAVAGALDANLGVAPADAVVTQLHAAGEVVAAAARRATHTVLRLPSYETVCKYAFHPGSRCQPESMCRACPVAAAMPEAEREALVDSRARGAAAMAGASELVASSAAVAATIERWSGRQATVVHPVVAPLTDARGRADGPAVAVAAKWNPNKGGERLPAIAAAIAPRPLRVVSTPMPEPLRRALGSAPNVELVAPRPIEEVLAGASMLLVPSVWEEPFGKVAFEACSAGIPVLASAVGGLVEFVPPAGLVHAHDDPAAWGQAEAPLRHPEAWRAAQRAAREAARTVLRTRPLDRLEAALGAARR